MKHVMILALAGFAVWGACAAPATLSERLKTRQPFMSAHRGWTPEAPENSLPSFTRAGELGFQAIEKRNDIICKCVAIMGVVLF